MKKIRTATLKNLYICICTHTYFFKQKVKNIRKICHINFSFPFYFSLVFKKKKEKSDSSRVVTVIIDEDMNHTFILISFLAYLHAFINTKKITN